MNWGVLVGKAFVNFRFSFPYGENRGNTSVFFTKNKGQQKNAALRFNFIKVGYSCAWLSEYSGFGFGISSIPHSGQLPGLSLPLPVQWFGQMYCAEYSLPELLGACCSLLARLSLWASGRTCSSSESLWLSCPPSEPLQADKINDKAPKNRSM